MYEVVLHWLDARNIQYVPATAGVFIFVKFLPQATTADQEYEFATKLERSGVLVSTGSAIHTGPRSKGWFRLVFALPEEQLAEALRKLEELLKDRSTSHRSGPTAYLRKRKADMRCMSAERAKVQRRQAKG